MMAEDVDNPSDDSNGEEWMEREPCDRVLPQWALELVLLGFDDSTDDCTISSPHMRYDNAVVTCEVWRVKLGDMVFVVASDDSREDALPLNEERFKEWKAALACAVGRLP